MRRFLFSPAKAGFTLFELLVSISIIGLLIALATVSFSAAQANARDARRRGDLTSMRNAFELHYASTNAYPSSCSNLASSLAAYLPGGVPVDPDPNTATVYTYSNCTTTTYCACVMMEKDEGGNSSNSTCNGSSTGDYYCVENLQ
jgi:prepilin-type N-terminal cleavage/methylation domain-containing protein